MSIHAAKPEKSGRLQSMLKALAGGVERSTAYLAEATGSVAVGTDVSELRVAGYDVQCRYAGRSENGRKVYMYKLVGKK